MTRRLTMRKLSVLLFCSVFAINILSGCGKTGEVPSDPQVSENTSAVSAEKENSAPAETLSFKEESEEDADTAADAVSEKETLRMLRLSLGSASMEQRDEEQDLTLVRVNYPLVFLDESDQKIFPELRSSLLQLNNTLKASARKSYETSLASARMEIADHDGSTGEFQSYTNTRNLSVRRCDSRAVSLLNEEYIYTGGPHEQTYTSGINYNSVTGEPLALTDVSSNFPQLKTVIREALTARYPDTEFYDLPSWFDRASESDFDWVLDYNGITFYFNPYILSPSAEEVLEIMIPFDANPDLFLPAFSAPPVSYSIPLQTGQEFLYDVNGNNICDSLRISETEDSKAFEISLNEKTFQSGSDEYILDISAYLMHTQKDQNFLYVEEIPENAPKRISVYDLSSGSLEEKGTLTASFHNLPVQDGCDSVKTLPGDPDGFLLDVSTDTLFPANACGSFLIGDDGMPVPEKPWYNFTDPQELSVLASIDGAVVDEETGVVLDTATVPAGEKLTTLRTDDDTFIDLQMKNGTIVRFLLDKSDAPAKINGTPVNELFDLPAQE